MICMSCENQSRSRELLSFFSRWWGATEGIPSAAAVRGFNGGAGAETPWELINYPQDKARQRTSN